jgi:hypothetical protein
MTAEQQAAYWKHQSRTHEDRSKGKDTTLAELQRQLDEVKRGQMSDTDKAIADRVDAEIAKYRQTMTADLVSARIEAAVSARGLNVEDVKALIDAADKNYFVKDGAPDPVRITAWAAALPAPATGTPVPPRPGTGPAFQGRESGNPTGVNGLSAGAAAYAADKGKPKSPFTP